MVCACGPVLVSVCVFRVSGVSAASSQRDTGDAD